MRSHQIEIFQGDEITEDVVSQAAELFSSHYGVWGKSCTTAEPGSRVHLTGSRLSAECLPTAPDSRRSLARVKINDVLAGHALVVRWRHEGRQVFWVTQLVVHEEYRRQRLATTLLMNLVEDEDEIFGLLSVNPFALKAMSRACGNHLFPHVPLDFARNNTVAVLKSSPVAYIKNAKPVGTLFKRGGDLRCGADTNFHIDQTDAKKAVAALEAKDEWPLGELPDGHEYLLLFDGRRRRRSYVYM